MKLKCRPGLTTKLLILATVIISLFIGGCFGCNSPDVVRTDPSDGETDVSVDIKIQVVFNRSIKPHDNWSDIILSRDGVPVPTTNSITGAVLWIEPVEELQRGATYTVILPKECVRARNTGGPFFPHKGGVYKDRYEFSFTTETGVSAPAVSSTDPVEGATGVHNDKTVLITFNKDIAQGDNWNDIALIQGQSAVPTTVYIDSENSRVLIVEPIDHLAPEVDFYLTIPAGAVVDQETGTQPLSAEFILNFQTGGPPSVISTDPADGDVNVPWNKTITVTFNKDIAQGTNYHMITLKNDTVSVPFIKSINGSVLTISPSEDLDRNVEYTVTVPAGAVNDTDGFELLTGAVFSFRTSDPPMLESSDPPADSINVPVDKTVTVTFSKNVVEGTSYDGIAISTGGEIIEAVKSISGATLSINPVEDFSQDTIYTVTIPPGAVQSSIGEPLTDEISFDFLTGYPPAIVSTSPVDGLGDIDTGSVITVTFDENILPADNWDDQIYLQTGAVLVPVIRSYDENVLIITPQERLLVNSAYTVTVGPGAIRDVAGNIRTDSYSFGFTTTDSYFFEDFSNGIPETWTIIDGFDDGYTWTVVDPGTFNIGSPFTDPCGVVNSSLAGPIVMDERLITPAIDISNGTGGINKLQFANCFTYYVFGLEEIADVNVRTFDGTVWTDWNNVLRMTGQSFGPELRIINLEALTAGKSMIQVEFHYYNARSEFWWLIDDVRVYESP